MALFVELFFVVCVLASVLKIGDDFVRVGYLRQPYMYNPNDTFMDWFNVLFWSYQWGTYEVWRAVYPPLAFLFVRVFSIPDCSVSWPFYARNCDWLATSTMASTYVVAAILAARVFYRKDKSTALLRSIGFAFGLPMLYALERGNLILLTLCFFIVAYSDLVSSKWWRWTSAAVTINLKPYLIVPLLSRVIKRDWRGFEMAGLLTLLIYLASWGLFGQGSLFEIADSLSTWAVSYAEDPWQPVFYTTTYAPMMNFETLNLPIFDFLPSRFFEDILVAIPILILASQVITFISLACAWIHPEVLPRHRTSALLLGCGLVSQSWGGYTQVLLIFLVFLEKWERPGPILALIFAYILSLSYDVYITEFPPGDAWWEQTGWLAGRSLEHRFGLTWGIFLRPGMVAIILWALAFDTLHLLTLAHRREPAWLRLGKQPRLAATSAQAPPV